MRGLLRRPCAWWGVLVCVGLPGAWLLWRALDDALGANPAQTLIRDLGDWALRGLVLTLAITPLRVLLGWPELARFRRLLGLGSATYVLLHLLAYAFFDKGLVLADILRDVAKRPFILVGMLAAGLMLVLALTSFNRAIRWLGAARWQALHRLVYAAAVLAVLHFWWMRAGKNDVFEPQVFAAVLTALLGWRLWRRLRAALRG